MDDPAAVEMVAKKTQTLIDNCGEWSVPEPTVTILDNGQRLTWVTDEGRVLKMSVLNNGLIFLADTGAWDSSPQWMPFHVTRLLAHVYGVFTGTK